MTIQTIIDWLKEKQYEFVFTGDESSEITGFASLNTCDLGRITWVKKKENYEKMDDHS